MPSPSGIELQVPDGQLRRFGSPRPRAVQELQQGVLAPLLQRGGVGSREQAVERRLFEVAHRHGRDLLARNGLDQAAPLDKFRTATGHVTGERSHGGQALIARLRRASALLLHAGEECQNAFDAQVPHGQAVHGEARSVGHQRQHQRERVPVAEAGVQCQVALAHQMLLEEAAQPGAEQAEVSHGRLRGRSRRTARSALPLSPADPGSWSGRPAWRRC